MPEFIGHPNLIAEFYKHCYYFQKISPLILNIELCSIIGELSLKDNNSLIMP